jgi:hypothetical protein
VEETEYQTGLKRDFASQLQIFCTQLDSMYDRQSQLVMQKEELEQTIDDLEQKLLEEARFKIDLNEKLAAEVQLRLELEGDFIQKLEKLSDMLTLQ